MRPVRTSILFRLTLWNASVLAAVLIIFTVAGWLTLSRAVRERTTITVRESARAVAGAIVAERRAATARGEVEAERGATEQAVLRELRVGDLDIFITDEADQVMAARRPERVSPDAAISMSEGEGTPHPVVIPPAVRALMDEIQLERQRGRVADTTVVVRRVSLDNGPARAAVLRVAPPKDDRSGEPALLITALRSEFDDDLLLRQVRTTLFFAIPLALIASIVAGFGLARRSLAPLEAINARTASISAANLDERLPVVNAHDELGRLAIIINDLLERVGQAFRTQRQFVADASHELRTPIAIIRGEADVTLRRSGRTEQEYRETLDVIRDESIRLTKIVEDLFLLARVDAGASIGDRTAVDLVELAQDAARSVRSLADARDVQVDVTVADGTTPLVMAGDAMLLRRLLLNLLDNALKHAPAQSVVTLQLARAARTLTLRVHDAGPGVAAQLRPRIFERFVHGRPTGEQASGSGAGLGLAIAQSIAHAHGGRITLLDDGPGATFEVTLPSSPALGVPAL
jgi:heavy metal sensor kinase